MATITSTASGLWSAGGTWVGGVAPGAADTAVIASGHTVTIDGVIQVNNIDVTGTLKFSRAASTSLELMSGAASYVRATGVFDMGRSGDIIPAAYTATLLGRGTWTCEAGSQVYAHGDYLFNGALNPSKLVRRVASLIAANASAAANTIVLSEDLGFRVGGGDTITVTGNRYTGSYGAEVEAHTVASYDPVTKTVTLVGTLAYAKTANESWVTAATERNVMIGGATGSNTFRWNFASNTTSYCLLTEVQFTGNFAQNYGLVYANAFNRDREHCVVKSCTALSTATTPGPFQSVGDMTAIGCHGGRSTETAVMFRSAYRSTFDYLFQTYNTGSGGGLLAGGTQLTLTDSVCVNATYSWMLGIFSTAADCKFWNLQYLQVGTGIVLTRCDLGRHQYFQGDAQGSRMIACSFDLSAGIGSVLRSSDHIVRDPVYLSGYDFDDFAVANSQVTGDSQYLVRLSDSSSQQKFGHALCSGIVVSSGAAGLPTGLFDAVPSGAAQVLKLHAFISSALQGVQAIQLPDGGGWFRSVAEDEVVTIRVNVWPKGWARTLTPSDVRLILIVPGDTTNYVSTESLTDDGWRQLSVSATALKSGTSFCYLEISTDYVASAELYVDFPIEMDPAGQYYVDALPQRALIRSVDSTADEIADAVWAAAAVADGLTPGQALKVLLAVAAGKTSGMSEGTPAFRDLLDSKDRISAALDAQGNRTAVTIDAI